MLLGPGHPSNHWFAASNPKKILISITYYFLTRFGGRNWHYCGWSKSIVTMGVTRCALLESVMIRVVVCVSTVVCSAAWQNLSGMRLVVEMQSMVETWRACVPDRGR